MDYIHFTKLSFTQTGERVYTDFTQTGEEVKEWFYFSAAFHSYNLSGTDLKKKKAVIL